jgi:hypothetical protein
MKDACNGLLFASSALLSNRDVDRLSLQVFTALIHNLVGKLS